MERSTIIYQAQWPKDVELRSIDFSPGALEHFVVNEIRYSHRLATADERLELKHIDEACEKFTEDFFTRHDWKRCKICRQYGCTPNECEAWTGFAREPTRAR